MIKIRFTILLLTTIFSALVSVLTADATVYYNFSGRGWGHGLGLSQYGAKGFAEKGYTVDKILETFYQKTIAGKVSNSTVRVHVAEKKSFINFISSTNFSFIDASNKKYDLTGSQNYRVYRNGSMYEVFNATSKKTKGKYKGPLLFRQGKNPIKLLNNNDNGVSSVMYRGSLRVILKGSAFTVINYIRLESYLRGVVPYEMPSSWHIEALKAQTVAARSYAVSSKKNYGDFDLYSTVYSQVYGGYSAENRRTNSAIRSTLGVVRTYNGNVIQALFFSSSGGKTENNENVWGGQPVPYLRGVNSPYEGTNAWTVKLSSSYLEGKLGKYSSTNTSGVRGTLNNLTIDKTGYSPRAVKVKISGSKGESYISGNKLRGLLKLKSTWFSISK